MEEPQILNPALKELSRLVGEWKTTGTHPYLRGKILSGRSSFKWLEGGAFLLWRSEIDDPNFPRAVAIFGSDNATNNFFMLYFDDRKISRKYEVSIEENLLRWWRNAPGFSQRYTWSFAENNNTIIGKGELSKDGTNWERDLEQTFTRVS